MQERLSVGNVKLLHAGGGLPHVHYFPTKKDPNLIEDENEHVKESYVRRVVCSKSSLLLLLLCLVALTSYLVWQAPRQEDDNIVEIPATENFLMSLRGSIKYQSIAHKNADTNAFSAEELSENVMDVVNETQSDNSINDSISPDQSTVPTEDDVEEVASEIHSATHRLVALINKWSKGLNVSEAEPDLTKFTPTDSAEMTMPFIIFLSNLEENSFNDETWQRESDETEETYSEENSFNDETWQRESDETEETYSEIYDSPFNIDEGDDE